MNILVIGAGGREHALCWALARSPVCEALFCAPGNGGTAELAHSVSLDLADHQAIIDFCRSMAIGLVVIGPEQPLVAGLVDDLARAGIKAFGPSALAARLEGSKGFTKDLCAKYHIPTAAYRRFHDADAARIYARQQPLPLVIKADGLAAGKGVIIADSHRQAEAAIDDILGGQFGEAGAELVIEAFLEGEEVSFFALCDGERAISFGNAQDHKRVGDGDQGPNTGGMGAYSPAPIFDAALEDEVMAKIIAPTLAAMKAEGCPYKGVLYAGLMITAEGPKLIEYNARFGDPECQVLMMRLASDLVPLLLASIDGTLGDQKPRWHEDAALTIVMAAKGYPGPYEKGTVIKGLDKAALMEGVEIFHAGTRSTPAGEVLAHGGRVLNIAATGKSVTAAQARAYAAIREIDWPQGFCRSDIGWRAIRR
ncbi:phosphoribosylamine--glycine ligase [Iodidimonas nitroreducens]|uniref:Phosphoribosylamine--glycine ligase n=1 Tax=Iodidimonas nitroreducens TaxID=1236968 RepID=A0A5A7NBA5_9PROT|nr:phosphoribosylamine--glycine ligase [Iodidimonas nitroreducens]GAK34216.1 phosphoribosylamine--glycine ligase [alpha proteobacterium Q-1]GER05004.1 phosphoribosylamine--glycine ligase [Iodidimonas nitroreducens]